LVDPRNIGGEIELFPIGFFREISNRPTTIAFELMVKSGNNGAIFPSLDPLTNKRLLLEGDIPPISKKDELLHMHGSERFSAIFRMLQKFICYSSSEKGHKVFTGEYITEPF